MFEIEGERFDVAVVGVEASESEVSRDLMRGRTCAEGRPRGPNVWRDVEVDGWIIGVVVVLSVLAEGVLRGPDGMRGGIEGAGRRSSVYISRRIFERPTMAAGWSAKLFRADSNCASAVYGADSATARAPRCEASGNCSLNGWNSGIGCVPQNKCLPIAHRHSFHRPSPSGRSKLCH